MSLILKMQINDQSENKYIFSTENGEIELIPLSVIENGTYTPEQGQAFSTVTVAVPQTVLEQLNITANGTYEASSGHAYDVVTVNVQPILDILVDTVNENGTYVYEPEEGYDGLEEVRVTVSVPEPVFEHLTRTITSNGTYNYSPSTGKDGFDEAQITVNVPQPQPNLEQKSAYYDTNGNYTIQPSQGYDGISEVSVEVDVSGGGGGDVLTGIVTMTDGENTLPITIPSDKTIKEATMYLTNFTDLANIPYRRAYVFDSFVVTPEGGYLIYGYRNYTSDTQPISNSQVAHVDTTPTLTTLSPLGIDTATGTIHYRGKSVDAGYSFISGYSYTYVVVLE